MGFLDIFKTKRKVKKPQDELKEKINNALGLAARFAKRIEKRDFNKMNNYLDEAKKLSNSLTKEHQERINKRIKEIRITGYSGEIKRILDRADKEIDSGSIRIPERAIKKAKEVAETAGIDMKEFDSKLKELEIKLERIKH